MSWNPDDKTKTVRVGQRVRDTLTWIQSVREDITDLKRMV